MRRLGRELDLFWVLLWRQFTPRSRRESFQLLWVFLEPIGQLAVLMLIFTLIGRMSVYGPSFALFLLTGMAPLTMFNGGSMMVAGAVFNLSSSTRLATVGMFHEAGARLVFNLLVTLVYAGVVLWAIGEIQRVPVAPQHPERLAAAFGLMTLMTFGVGLLRGYAMLFFPVAERVYAMASRGLLFVSGIFYVPSFMPPQLRDWLALNPALHGVELTRLGIYDQYPTIIFSAEYLLCWAMGTTALGMAMLWRRRARVLG